MFVLMGEMVLVHTVLDVYCLLVRLAEKSTLCILEDYFDFILCFCTVPSCRGDDILIEMC